MPQFVSLKYLRKSGLAGRAFLRGMAFHNPRNGRAKLNKFILGVFAAVAGYVTLDLLWRSSIADYKLRKRDDRLDRES